MYGYQNVTFVSANEVEDHMVGWIMRQWAWMHKSHPLTTSTPPPLAPPPTSPSHSTQTPTPTPIKATLHGGSGFGTPDLLRLWAVHSRSVQ